MRPFLRSLSVLVLAVNCGFAAVLSVPPAADTSLMEVSPTNNNGAERWLLSGTTQNTPRTRALMRFDLSAIPTNSVVRSGQVILVVTRQSDEAPANSVFGLHRMFRPWSEGTQVATQLPGQGFPAQAGETTWSYAFYPTNSWTSPGGQAGTDFAWVQSSYQFIYSPNESPYLLESTPELVADLTGWIRDPLSNHGWMLLCDDEGTPFTARRFGSREDSENAPLLQVDYVVPPVFDKIALQDTKMVTLGFTAWPGHTYEVQHRETLSNSAWIPLHSFPPVSQKTNISLVTPAATPAGFFRLMAY